jgi:hypothetical protein
LDHEAKPEKEAPDQDGCELGQGVQQEVGTGCAIDWMKARFDSISDSTIFTTLTINERAMSSNNDFFLVFDELRKILKRYAEKLTLTADTPDTYYVDGPYSEKWKKQLFFGSAQIKKNYVSFYLMPVYMYPDLLKNISPELKKHMQGKSCFNFKKVEPALFAELAELTRRSIEKFQKENGS